MTKHNGVMMKICLTFVVKLSVKFFCWNQLSVTESSIDSIPSCTQTGCCQSLIALMLPVYFLGNKFLLLKESIHRKRIIYNGLLPYLIDLWNFNPTKYTSIRYVVHLQANCVAINSSFPTSHSLVSSKLRYMYICMHFEICANNSCMLKGWYAILYFNKSGVTITF